eukprot:7358392-Alexandrium_andersonii.AAC.1
MYSGTNFQNFNGDPVTFGLQGIPNFKARTAFCLVVLRGLSPLGGPPEPGLLSEPSGSLLVQPYAPRH